MAESIARKHELRCWFLEYRQVPTDTHLWAMKRDFPDLSKFNTLDEVREAFHRYLREKPELVPFKDEFAPGCVITADDDLEPFDVDELNHFAPTIEPFALPVRFRRRELYPQPRSTTDYGTTATLPAPPPPWADVKDAEVEAIFRECALWPVIEACRNPTVPPLPIQAGLGKALALAGCFMAGRAEKPSGFASFTAKGPQLARLYVDTSGGQALNFFIMQIAPPSSGKDIGAVDRRIANARGLMIGTGGSAEGILDALTRCPSGYMPIGEFENYLDTKAWQFKVQSLLADLFTSCSYKHTLSERGKSAQARECDYCAPSLVANIQDEILLQHGNTIIKNGLANRFLLIRIPHAQYRPRVGSDSGNISAALDALACYEAKCGAIVPPQDYLQDVLTILTRAKAPHERYIRRLVEMYGPRIATVLSVKPGDRSPAVNITPETWERTGRVILWLYAQAEDILSRLNRAPDDKWEAILDRVLEVVTERGPCTTKVIHQNTGRWDIGMRVRAIAELVGRGKIIEQPTQYGHGKEYNVARTVGG